MSKPLTPRQHAAIGALVQGQTLTGTAEALGIARKTVWRWTKDPDFAAALEEASADVVQQACRRVSALCEKAASTLEQILGDTDAGESARVGAARCVLAATMQLREIVSVEGRLAELEGVARFPSRRPEPTSTPEEE